MIISINTNTKSFFSVCGVWEYGFGGETLQNRMPTNSQESTCNRPCISAYNWDIVLLQSP
jgi:hypothetical protein